MSKINPSTTLRTSFTIFRNGFTLIELLVVISILGVLAGLVISNMAGVRERARDVQRKSDLKQVQTALEMYKKDQASVSYLVTTNWATLAETLQGGPDKTGTIYMKNVPWDPFDIPTGVRFPYNYSCVAATPLKYILFACLENKSDAQGVAELLCDSGFKFQLEEP